MDSLNYEWMSVSDEDTMRVWLCRWGDFWEMMDMVLRLRFSVPKAWRNWN